ncbi:MAG TPA: alpha-glucosidase [Xanthomonadaceae bacterium]|nr:alpha-glucosidase [Xanthomonadaceae bacterium]
MSGHPRPAAAPHARADWWRGAVIYQIYPRSFQDSNGDGIGDLPGAMARLEHVARLGADAVWISPFFRSPMRDFGYDVADYRDVDPLFGTLADFDRLLERAHALGLKVLIDQVLSHTSDQHAWFGESRTSRDNPRADWYVWADPKPDGGPPNNWLSVFGGPAWQWDARRRQYYLHQFLPEQPDLNFHCAPAVEALLDEVRFWCERGVDGFRFDACNHQFSDARLRDNPPAEAGAEVSTVQADNPYAMQRHLHDKSQPENLGFLERLRGVLDKYGAIAMGEVGDEDAPPLMAAYTEAGRRLHMAYSFALLTRDGSAAHIRHEVQRLGDELARTDGWGCWAFSNHDVERVASRWSPRRAHEEFPPPNLRQTRMLWALLSSLRGSVCVYQGEELGLPQAEVPFELLQDPYGKTFWPEFRGRDGCRTPLPWQSHTPNAGFTGNDAHPWLPIADAQRALAVDVQDADAGSMLAFARTWLHWRRTQAALREGAIRFHDVPHGLLLFERGEGEPALRLLFNLADAPVARALAPGWRDITPDFVHAHGLGCADGEPDVLPPYGLRIAARAATA